LSGIVLELQAIPSGNSWRTKAGTGQSQWSPLKEVAKEELGNGRSLSLASDFGKILEPPTEESVCQHPEDNREVSNDLHRLL